MFMSNQLQLPQGFRFHPTDEELMIHYLCRKCAAQPIAVPIIAEIDLYKFDPWQLPGMALYGEKEWYFFSPRDRKYPNGSRPNRAAGTGYWKATGADKPIGRPKTVGIKKALVFYVGKSPSGEKTNWIMHEYRLANVDRSARNANNFSRLDDWVLCRIYNKKGTIEKHPAIDRRLVKHPEDEDRKPQILLGYNDANAMPAQTMMVNQLQHLEAPWLHATMTDSSGSASEQVGGQPSEKEVHSEPKWNDLEEALNFQFNYMDDYDDDAFSSDPFAPFQLQFQQNPFQQQQQHQEMLMYIDKPFY